MNAKRLQEIMKGLGLNMENMETCSLNDRHENLTSHKQLRASLNDFVTRFPQAQGWLCFQSCIRHFRGGPLPDEGLIRYGELAGDNGNTLLVRPNLNSGWRLIYLTEQQGDSLLGEEVTHLGREKAPDGSPGPGDPKYRRYWAWDKEVGYRAVAARFIGFQEKKRGET